MTILPRAMTESSRSRHETEVAAALPGDARPTYGEPLAPPPGAAAGRAEPLARLIGFHVEEQIGAVRTVMADDEAEVLPVDILHVPPARDRSFHVLVTCGMSARPMRTPPDARGYRLAELLICLPGAWPIGSDAFAGEQFYWPVRWLRRLARFPHEQETWLGAGHSIPNGEPPEPIAPDTELCGFLLLPPLSLSVASRRLVLDEERTVHFWCVMPLHADEIALKVRQGAEALFPRFDEAGVTDVVEMQRRSVARRRFWPF